MEGPVEIRVVGEGESGVVGRRVLTDALAESLASYWSLPESERRKRFGPADVAYLAARLGVTPAFVRKHQRNPRVLASIKRRVNDAVVLMMPEIVHTQAQKAIMGRDTPAARFLAEMSGFIKQSGITVQQNVGINVNQLALKESITEDRQNLEWLKNLRDSGYLQRIDAEVTVKEDGPNGTGDQPGAP